MPKFSAVGCTNRSTKNPNLSFHSDWNEWLQNIRKTELPPKYFYISTLVPSLIAKRVLRCI